ncbi:hypothetical protein EJ03DRAFT_17055 [Teratosphaeria nubilosa]|uniref:Uncharacterized protein n=1 Tax=Teratosphaeria nubilosa TaxID=161662 RepID=A0A6G1KXI2_9PEZI|nr:hypothetical protein EJ03DRAFT_17055 [Teratosphaeria nubilosa]
MRHEHAAAARLWPTVVTVEGTCDSRDSACLPACLSCASCGVRQRQKQRRALPPAPPAPQTKTTDPSISRSPSRPCLIILYSCTAVARGSRIGQPACHRNEQYRDAQLLPSHAIPNTLGQCFQFKTFPLAPSRAGIVQQLRLLLLVILLIDRVPLSTPAPRFHHASDYQPNAPACEHHRSSPIPAPLEPCALLTPFISQPRKCNQPVSQGAWIAYPASSGRAKPIDLLKQQRLLGPLV